jgi:DNA polymerase-3 subunit epsilon
MRQIALDTETTGLNPFDGHRVVEIGCVEMVNYVRTGRHFHVYLNPERSMPMEAYRVHGLSDEFLSDKPRFREVVREFLDFIGNDPLVIHNAEFDMKFLNAEMARLKRPAIPLERAIDTVQIARKRFPGSPANLDALCKRFSIDLSARTLHGALLDAELLAEVYLELMGGRQTGLGFDAAKANESALSSTNETVLFEKVTDFPRRNFSPSAEELERHKAFTAKIKNALWQSFYEAKPSS